MSELRYDEAATRRLLAVYSTPDVAAQRAEFLRALGPRPAERVLDVGCGPGFLAAAIAEAVGAEGAVEGIDISEPLLAVARQHCADRPRVTFRTADASRLPFPDGAFDAAVSTQVLEYVPDVDRALAEVHRVVRSGGRILVVDTDWDSIVWHDPDPRRMDRILAAWEGHAPHPRLPRTLGERLLRAGFELDTLAVSTLFNPVYDVETYSNRMIDLIAAYVSGRDGVTADDAQAWARELREAGARGEWFFSLNRYLFAATRV
jgi:SAM-dependent methyltransferase